MECISAKERTLMIAIHRKPIMTQAIMKSNQKNNNNNNAKTKMPRKSIRRMNREV